MGVAAPPLYLRKSSAFPGCSNKGVAAPPPAAALPLYLRKSFAFPFSPESLLRLCRRSGAAAEPLSFLMELAGKAELFRK